MHEFGPQAIHFQHFCLRIVMFRFVNHNYGSHTEIWRGVRYFLMLNKYFEKCMA